MIGVVIPCLNNFTGLAETIASCKSSRELEFHIIPNWEHHWSVAKSWNHGIRRASHCDYILIVNDDISLSDVSIDRLATYLAQNPQTALVSASDVRDEGISNLGVRDFRPAERYELLPSPHFSCFMVTNKLLDQVGEFDENFTPAYYEDNDMTRRIVLSEYEIGRLYCAPFYHHGSVTRYKKGVSDADHAAFDRNRQYFMQKWGGDKDQETFATPFNDPNLTIKDWEVKVYTGGG